MPPRITNLISCGEPNENRKHQSGFSLLELLATVAIILIVSAIAIPNLMRSKMSANEASAVGSLRATNAACTNYSSTWGKGS
jgi:prepilin-type N-terminal cleavage/methylation domain-containing protein